MKQWKLLVYALMPYVLIGLLGGIQIQKIMSSNSYDTKGMQTLSFMTALFLGLMLFVMSHCKVELKWKRIIGSIHAISFLLFSVLSYGSLMNTTNVFGNSQAYAMLLIVLSGNSPTLVTVTIFMVCDWIYTFVKPKLPNSSVNTTAKTKRTTINSYDTWLES